MEWKYYETSKNIVIDKLITAFEVTRETYFYFSGEMHDFWEIVQVVDGEVTVSADDRVYVLGKNSVIFHKPMEFHKIWSNNNTEPRIRIISFTARGDFIKKFEDKFFEFTPGQSYEFGKIVNDAAEWILERSVRNDTNLKYRSQIITNRLEIFLLELNFTNLETGSQNDLHGKDRNFQRILKAMHEHYRENLDLPTLAIICNLSVSNMKKIFHEFYDQGIMAYFNGLKIRSAITMLKTDMPIREISDSLGFDNQNYFSQVFKKYTGLSPTAYRKQLQK